MEQERSEKEALKEGRMMEKRKRQGDILSRRGREKKGQKDRGRGGLSGRRRSIERSGHIKHNITRYMNMMSDGIITMITFIFNAISQKNTRNRMGC